MLLLGIWKNVEELEEFLSMPELEAILTASREKERREQRFMAALKGIDLDKEDAEDAREKFEKVQRRAQSRLTGVSAETLEMNDFGFDVEVE